MNSIAENKINSNLNTLTIRMLFPAEAKTNNGELRYLYGYLVAFYQKDNKRKLNCGVQTRNHWKILTMENIKIESEEQLQLEIARLQKELEIEASLERVRLSAMSMRTSNDVGNATSVLFGELVNLGIKTIRCGIIIGRKEEEKIELWTATSVQEGQVMQIIGEVDANIHPLLKGSFDAWVQKKEFFSFKLEGKDKEQYYQSLASSLNYAISDRMSSLPDHYCTSFMFAEGGLFAFTFEPFSPENSLVLKKFAHVFSQTYRRYLDLQKAEAQAREAQIEAALERVRSRTIGMQRSDELQDAAIILFEQIELLGTKTFGCGFNIWDKDKEYATAWMAGEDSANQGRLRPPFKTKSSEDIFARIREAAEKGESLFVEEQSGVDLVIHYNYMISIPEFKIEVEKLAEKSISVPSVQYMHCAFFSRGYLMFISYEPVREMHDIFIRFAKVFEQTYIRFLDLQKAEKQARESEIQLALERVRARTMAMYKSSELNEVAAVLFEQIRNLGGKLWGTGFALCNIKEGMDEFWFANELGVMPPVSIPNTEDEVHRAMYQAWKEKKDYLLSEKGGEELGKHYRYLNSLPQIKAFFEPVLEAGHDFPIWQQWHAAYFSKGYLLIITVERYPEPDILKRFAKVFEQTYTRFLDLQKAEAQAREAQIEAALERVRSRTMGMQHSDELKEAANLLFQQVLELGAPVFGCGFNIWAEDMKSTTAWMSGQDRIQEPFKVPSSEDIFLRIYEANQKGETLFVEEQGGEALKTHYEYMNSIPVFKEIADKMASVGQSFPTFQIMHCAFFSQGYLMFITYEPVPDAYEIFKRFAKVFEQTYTRFLDLQKAEAQAREAVKQSSLDRVRGQIASMRTADDLQRITPVIWHELNALGVPFIRCGVFIVEEKKSNVHIYLTTPDGKPLGALRLPVESTSLTRNIVHHWEKGVVYREHWNRDQFIEWAQSMLELGQIQDKKTYQGSEQPPESLDLHFVPFKQGMLYVGNVAPLSDDKIELAKALAEAFSIAYARYEDFDKLEKAKESIEATLTELKATQSQLIQSEKMASLGELTAGIAHEIQNPLNFVNNFSEVSKELLDEMKMELDNGNTNDAKELANDVILNLEKINHHGKRADAIVKGMLQHSRISSGQKEPTDINALADEYLRLAYHGLRAKDKSFNATMNTNFDESIGKINVVPQEIGRVILNLITNAFYVVNEKKKLLQNGYEHTVSVITKRIGSQVSISVKDNGNGIPENIKDKIFQPFFTTKPTGSGTGLGLSLSYDIVKAHGGELRVETKAGEGSEFIILIPTNSIIPIV